MYPSEICGQLALRLTFTMRGLVYCQVPPVSVYEAHEFLSGTPYVALQEVSLLLHSTDILHKLTTHHVSLILTLPLMLMKLEQLHQYSMGSQLPV